MERSWPKGDLQELNTSRLMFGLCRRTRMKDMLLPWRGEGSAVTICVPLQGHSLRTLQIYVWKLCHYPHVGVGDFYSYGYSGSDFSKQ
jgi:hypothetical protein